MDAEQEQSEVVEVLEGVQLEQGTPGDPVGRRGESGAGRQDVDSARSS
jgi:hypothetical protein